MAMTADRGEDIMFTARDGLRLHARRYSGASESARPLLCLAGLTRNGRDFHDIAMALSAGPGGRTVWTLDCRGRGASEHDPDWKNYTVPIEVLDVVDLACIAGLHGAAILGTSRGGLIAMVLAAMQPTVIGAVVLNDIGPVIDRDGLIRISSYVGRTPLPASWEEAAALIKDLSRRHFPDVSDAVWAEVARAWYNERDGRPAPGYDAKLGRTMSVKDGPIPELWPQFRALSRVPLLVLRGEGSDILSAATLKDMQLRHPRCQVHIVPGQGHAPLLKDEATIGVVARFLEQTDERHEAVGRVSA